MNSTTITRLISCAVFMLVIGLSYAEKPKLTFTPQTATTFGIYPGQTQNVIYKVTNTSNKTQVLAMQPLAGVSQNSTTGNCATTFTLAPGAYCLLNLTVTANSINGDTLVGGPKVCRQDDKDKCDKKDKRKCEKNECSRDKNGNYRDKEDEDNDSDDEAIKYSEKNPSICDQPRRIDRLNVTVLPVVQNTTLGSSVNEIGLSVNDAINNPALTGTTRTITITNTGAATANGVTVVPTGTPLGTTITNNCTVPILSGGTCTITISPGNTPTDNPTTTGIIEGPAQLTVTGSNVTNTLTLNVDVVTYGSVYQGGYVYAVDDTTPNTGSIGGKVAALTDQAPAYPYGILWSSDSTGAYDNGISIFGIAENSTALSPSPNTGQVTGQTACNGSYDGACNTANILAYYSTAINSSYYAAGLCKATIGGLSDWYLPAICEMGPNSNGSGCSAGTPNMVDNLDILRNSCSGSGCLAGYYWSSTEDSLHPAFAVWQQDFLGSGSTQGNISKNGHRGVRCSRALTP